LGEGAERGQALPHQAPQTQEGAVVVSSNKTPDPVFVYCPSDGGSGSLLLNIFQIVMIDAIADDQLVIHLSDGTTNRFQGAEFTEKFLALVAEYTVTLDGRPFLDVIREIPPHGPKLVKPTENNV
jgi:hypothetical protein